MLKIIDTVLPVSVDLVVDEYVPLDISFDVVIKGPEAAAYWRSGDLEKNLLGSALEIFRM